LKAVILAGGEGSRLGNLSKSVPKPMVPIAGKPILEHQIMLCKRYGINDFLLLTGRLGNVVEEYFGDGSQWGVRIEYFQEPYPLGTTGGMKACEARLDEDFLVLYGDVMMEMDLGRLVQYHQKKQAVATLVLHPNDHPHDSDLAEVDEEGRITQFLAKPRSDEGWYANLVNAAVYVLSPKLLAHLQEGVKEDWGRHIFPRLVKSERLYGYNTPEYVKDVGTPERLEEVTKDLLSGKVARLNLENSRPAIFLDRDGVINRYVHLLQNTEQFELLPGVPAAIRAINDSENLTVVVTNQPVVARGMCTEEEVREVHRKMETLLGRERAKLDAIYYCPHHPDRGYPEENPLYKIPCDCRKPTPGMVERAARELHVELSKSCIIGDTSRDIQTGINAGMAAYAVRSGSKYGDDSVPADGWFDDLAEAAKYVLADPYADQVCKLAECLTTRPGPTVYAIGGNTRSGKTLMASRLRRELARQGVETLVVHLDDWLVPLGERQESMSLEQRYDVSRAALDIEKILAGEPVSLDAYSAATRERGSTVQYDLGDASAVVIEGVVALASERLRELANVKVHLHIHRDLLEARVRTYYRWKGLAPKAIEALLESRWQDEYPPISESERFADFVFGPGDK
jgi:histidinol-phosphate phosphatase family protein